MHYITLLIYAPSIHPSITDRLWLSTSPSIIMYRLQRKSLASTTVSMPSGILTLIPIEQPMDCIRLSSSSQRMPQALLSAKVVSSSNTCPTPLHVRCNWVMKAIHSERMNDYSLCKAPVWHIWCM